MSLFKYIYISLFFLPVAFGMTVTSRTWQTTLSPLSLGYLCRGSGLSPDLHITDVSPRVRSLFVIISNVAQTVHYWIVTNIPRDTTYIKRSADRLPLFHQPFVQLPNSFGLMKYSGPCPQQREGGNYQMRIIGLDSVIPQSILQESIADNGTIFPELAYVKKHTVEEVVIKAFYDAPGMLLEN